MARAVHWSPGALERTSPGKSGLSPTGKKLLASEEMGVQFSLGTAESSTNVDWRRMMILVWGFKALFKTIESGTFFCPNEGGDRGYRRRQARKWFTFFWIPIIPLQVLGEQIECDACGAAYDPRVLELPTTSHIQDSLTSALRHVVVAMLRADDVIEPEEKTRAIEIVKRFGHDDYDLELLSRDLVELSVGDLDEELVAVAQMLTTQGQEAVIEACLALAAADGHVDESELKVIENAGRSLGMSPAHVRGVLAGITEEAES